jgi:hypothetical protein
MTEYQTTHLLNSLLDGYDKRLHPGMVQGRTSSDGGHPRPTEISVNMNIRSMGPISEIDMVRTIAVFAATLA